MKTSPEVLKALKFIILSIKSINCFFLFIWCFQVSQGHFDLLAELMKFNEDAFAKFEEAVGTGERFDRFMRLASGRFVDFDFKYDHH